MARPPAWIVVGVVGAAAALVVLSGYERSLGTGLRLVRALQSHGEIVAVTGDGVNDVPSRPTANGDPRSDG